MLLLAIWLLTLGPAALILFVANLFKWKLKIGESRPFLLIFIVTQLVVMFGLLAVLESMTKQDLESLCVGAFTSSSLYSVALVFHKQRRVTKQIWLCGAKLSRQVSRLRNRLAWN